MPLVSVVIPAYNAARWIAETLESVLAQTFQDFEVIVVDDGSTDDTAAIVARFARARYIRKQSGGPASARNVGIRAAQGEYVAFVDSDDLWSPDKLRLQIDLLRQSGVAWVYCDAYAFDDETRRTLFIFSKVRRQYSGDVLGRLFLADFIPMPTPVIRRNVLEQMGYFDERGEIQNSAEDWDLWLRIAARYPIGLVNRPLAWYRVHTQSRIQSGLPSVIYNAHLNVIELAASREPARLAPLKRRAIAMAAIRIGQMMVRRNDLAHAREMFVQAIRLAPFEWKAYAYWLGTLAGRPVTNTYVRLLHWWWRKRSADSEPDLPIRER
jgi:glycosyltransferase involved in cell wall biosynthesis